MAGIKFEAEGYGEFKRSLNDIKASLKVVSSELRVTKSEFDKNDNSVAALTAKNKSLSNSIQAQRKHVDHLAEGVKAATKEWGENDKRTQALTVQYNRAQAELNKLEREFKDNEKAARDVSRGYDDAGNKLDEFGNAADKNDAKFEKLGGTLKGIGVAVGAVVVAAGAAAVALGKEVVSAFADYEQLVGGVDTLFGDSSAKVQEYASNAFKTAGISANEYMETVTGFSASLIQSLGGDTEKAAKYADMAITDMSDNANKMGTDMSSIQNAYQGFAKQNYTMLDNLKLGYGGTKAEMERLLVDAGKIAGVEFDISSYADVTEAIHVMQESMGIAGTTALEAEHTISGSISSMGAAWKNLIVGLGDSNADIKQLTENLAKSFQTVVKNITPVIENLVSSLPIMLDALLGALTSMLPKLLSVATSLLEQVINAIVSALPELIPAAVSMIMTIVDALIANLPLIVDGAIQLVLALALGLAGSLPELIPAAIDAIITVVETLIDNVDMLVDAAIAIIMALADGLITALPRLIENAPEIVITLLGALIENAPKILAAGIELIGKLIEGIWSVIVSVVKAGGDIIGKIGEGITGAFDSVVQWGKDIIDKLWEGLKAAWESVVLWFKGVWDSLFGNLTANVTVNKEFTGVDGSFASGLNFVPFDGFVAELHRGEMVVPANLAESLRSLGISAKRSITSLNNLGIVRSGGAGNTVNIYPRTLDNATIDYIYAKFNARLGGEM